MIFRLATAQELNTVYTLYKSVIGTEFCVWDDTYPGMQEVNHDFETKNLYVLEDEGQIAGALSVVPENEMDHLPCWQIKDGGQKEVGRIVVAKSHRGRGLAGYMVSEIMGILRAKGWKAVHISCAKVNTPAQKTYARLGFQNMGEAELYGHSYYLLEKVL